jgi:uncharacterized protein (TIGR03382 family)
MSKFMTFGSVAFALAGSAGFAGPSYPLLLTVNDSDPTAVTITATTQGPAIDYNGNTVNEGVDLLGFFSSDESGMTVGPVLSGTLQGGDSGFSYDDVNSDNESSGGGSYFDLQLSLDPASPGSGTLENFTTGQPAFTGSWTIDLSSLGVDASALPAAGTEGEIISGYSGGVGDVIGDWQVVATDPTPEPGTGSLLAVGVLAMGILVYRRRAAAAKRRPLPLIQLF